MNEHKHFEIMCGLAVVGQLNDADLRELKPHIESCVACQTRLSDFAQISSQALPLYGERYSNHRLPKAMSARFVERARAEGVPLRISAQLPSKFFIRPLGQKGNLAAAVLLIAIIAIGVSKFGHPRVQSAITATPAQSELLSDRSIQTRDTQNRSTPRPTERLLVGKPKRAHSRFVASAQTPHRRNLEQSSRSSLPLLAASPIQYLTTRLPDQADLKTQLFPSIADAQHPRFFRADDTKPERRQLNAPLLLALAEYRPRMNVADNMAADFRGNSATFKIFSLGGRSDSFPNMDWYQVWLRTGAASLRNSNDSPQFHPDALGSGWPFSKEDKQ